MSGYELRYAGPQSRRIAGPIDFLAVWCKRHLDHFYFVTFSFVYVSYFLFITVV